VYASPQIESLLGITPDEFTSTPFADHVHPEDAARVVASSTLAYENLSSLDEEYRMVWRDGSIV
jgi:PAS domain-containing protein